MQQPTDTAPRASSRTIWHAIVVIAAAWVCAAVLATAVERVSMLPIDGLGSLGPRAAAALVGGFASAMLAQMLLGTILWLVAAATKWLPGRADDGRRRAVFASIAGLAAAVPGWLLGAALAQGAWVSGQGWAWVVAPILAVAIGFTVYAVALLALKAAARRAASFIAGSLLAAAGAALILLDSRVLQGTYPEVHLAAFLAGVLPIWIGCALIMRPVIPRPPPSWARPLALVAIAAGLAASVFWVVMDRATRTELLLNSPVAANVIRLMHPGIGTPTYLMRELNVLDPRQGRWEPGADRPRGLLAGLEDHNVILVVVDTLRADALPPARKRDMRFAHRSDTPFFNRWMSEAHAFEHAYAQAPITHRSMPPMFRSLEVCDDFESVGVPLATAMAAAGLTPFAVVNNFFLEPRYKDAQRLLDGFEHIGVYEKQEQDEIIDLTRGMVDRLRGGRFFGWVHFYNMHAPGYDGRLQSGRLPLEQRYRSSLVWLDRKMEELVEVLAAAGELERTIIVLTADHGENLGDNGMQYHGLSVYEEELRVPLAVWIPGHRGRVLRETVGNIDLLPTILDLLGRPAEPNHRGVSLVPLMAGEDSAPPRPYYLQNKDESIIGLVLDRQKLIHDRKADVLYRFDLDRDPTEDANCFDPESKIDQRLMRLMFQVDPSLVAAELEDEDTLALLARKLSRVDPARPGEAVDLLVRLGAVAKTRAVTTEALGLFDRTPLDELKLLLARHFFDHDPVWGERLADHLADLRETAPEGRFVAALAAAGVGVFAEERVAARMAEIAEGPAAEWEPWLSLVAPWKTGDGGFVPVFGKMLDRAWEEEAPLRTVNLLLGSVASHDFATAREKRMLRRQARRFIGHPEPFARAAALGAVAHLGDRATVPAVEALVRGEEGGDVRVRQAAIHALAALRGKAAVDAIVEAGKDPVLTLDAVRALSRIRSKKALPFLRDTARNHYNQVIRKNAKNAIRRIERG